ncbi:hypothetical protein [Azospirillum argentinense]|uniref:hypothetical protein n=1 Tax=Azospirillum argentinense TaxID=2970906 RepID=UPI0032E0484C
MPDQLIIRSISGRAFIIEPAGDHLAYTVTEPAGAAVTHPPMDFDEAKDLLAWDLAREHARIVAAMGG